MNRLQSIQKLYSSRIALTIIFGLPFGLLTYFASYRHDRGSILIYLLGGLIFGLLMTLSMRKKYLKLAGNNLQLLMSNKVARNKTFNSYLKNGQAPQSKLERQELTQYINKLESRHKAILALYYPQKRSKLMSYGVLSLFFVGTLAMKSLRLLALVYPVIVAIGLYGEYRERLLGRRIAVMKSKLAV